jgi:hypothetical protein
MNLKRVLLSLVFTLGFMALTLAPRAQSPPPDRINYQGVLRDSAGAPMDGLITMTFRFYDAASGGTILWEEIYDPVVYPPQVTVSGGLFTAALGDSAHRNDGAEASFAGVFSNRAEVYLAVKVDTDSEMTPRVRVVSAAYSINSGALDGREAASFASAAHLHAGGDITSGTLDDARLSSNVAHLGVAETITGNWINTANPWDDSEVTNKLTIDATGTVADGALSATVANLNATETIAANWVNTANPWADDEVSDVLTLGAGSTIDASVDVGDADMLDGNHGTYYAKATHFHSTLTAGTGLGGGTYDGTAAATFAVQYGTSAGTAVQGNQTAKITAGSGLTGGIPSDALGDGFSATLDVVGGNGITASADSLGLGPLTANWNQTGAFDIILANAGGEILMLEAGGGTDYGTLDMGTLSGTQTYTFSGTGGDVWTSGNDGAGSGLNADLLDGEHSSYFMKGTTDNWVDITGDTMTGKLNLPKSLTTSAGLNLGSAGVAPTSPWDGDIWLTTGGLGAYFNGYKAGFLDTTPQPQTKTGKLTLNVSGTALDVTGTITAAQFAASTPWSNAFLASSGTGITANGSDKGAIFRDDGGAFAYLATADYGIEAMSSTGAHFANTAGTAETKIAYFFAGIEATGTAVGGAFDDSDSSGYAYVAYGDYGIDAQGNTAGGYFHDSNSSGHADVAYGDLGISASGNTAGGRFEDSTTSSYSYNGYGNYGIEGRGATSGAYFTENDAGGVAEAWLGRYYASSEYWGIRAYGATGGAYLGDNTSGDYARVGYDTYKAYGTGTNSFVQNHPQQQDRVIVYAAPEGDEVATYTRGTAKLVNGEAVVRLGETFQWVTNPDIGLTVHLTPVGEWADLYVASKSTTDLVVRSKDGKSNVAFDYLIYGLRIGFEEISIVQVKKEPSWIPSMKSHRDLYQTVPELQAFNALERFKAMETAANLRTAFDFSASQQLKTAIHEFDPAVDTIPSEHDQNPASTSPTGKTSLQGSSDSRPLPIGMGRERQPAPMPATAPAPDGTLPGVAPAPAIPASVSAFAVKEAVERGDILVVNPASGDELYRCQQASDPMVVGISASAASASGEVPVFQYGTTWVRVDAQYGPIARGDLLVTSPTPGHAMMAQPKIVEGVPIYTSGTIIGKALEPLATGTGLIKVLVMLR